MPMTPINQSKASSTRSKTLSTMPLPEILPIPLPRLSPPPFSSSSQPACYWTIAKPVSASLTPRRLGKISRHTSPWPIATFAKLTPQPPVAESQSPTQPKAFHPISPTPPNNKRLSTPLPILHLPLPTIASQSPPSTPPLSPSPPSPPSPPSLLPPTPN